MRILVTGTEGQLARSLREAGAEAGIELVTLSRPALDLARPDTVAAPLAEARPDAIVNAAAWTRVDAAEGEEASACRVNAEGAGAVARAAAALGVPLVQISTDYVFDGAGQRPYREDDPVAPVGAYGRSKLAGELAVVESGADAAIIRTAWVFSPFGGNFVRTMLRLAADRDEVRVVADQHGSPTYAHDLARALLRICGNLRARPAEPGLRGVFHLANAGHASWAELAGEVFAVSARLGGPTARVVPITTAEYPTPARRPANSRLDLARAAARHGVALPDWRDAVGRCVTRLLKEGGERA